MRKAVLVTGASGGIGSEAVRQLDEIGWRVFAGVRSEKAAEHIETISRRVVPVRLDVCDEGSIAAARSFISSGLQGEGLDGLVNNAGASVDGPVELLSLDALRRQLDLNVVGQVA